MLLVKIPFLYTSSEDNFKKQMTLMMLKKHVIIVTKIVKILSFLADKSCIVHLRKNIPVSKQNPNLIVLRTNVLSHSYSAPFC